MKQLLADQVAGHVQKVSFLYSYAYNDYLYKTTKQVSRAKPIRQCTTTKKNCFKLQKVDKDYDTRHNCVVATSVLRNFKNYLRENWDIVQKKGFPYHDIALLNPIL